MGFSPPFYDGENNTTEKVLCQEILDFITINGMFPPQICGQIEDIRAIYMA
jgi:hypothetical protein